MVPTACAVQAPTTLASHLQRTELALVLGTVVGKGTSAVISPHLVGSFLSLLIQLSHATCPYRTVPKPTFDSTIALALPPPLHSYSSLGKRTRGWCRSSRKRECTRLVTSDYCLLYSIVRTQGTGDIVVINHCRRYRQGLRVTGIIHLWPGRHSAASHGRPQGSWCKENAAMQTVHTSQKRVSRPPLLLDLRRRGH